METEKVRDVFLKDNVLRTVFAAIFCISNFILHASAVDIIWETALVMAQLWPSFSPSVSFFSTTLAVQIPLDLKTLHFRPGPRA